MRDVVTTGRSEAGTFSGGSRLKLVVRMAYAVAKGGRSGLHIVVRTSTCRKAASAAFAGGVMRVSSRRQSAVGTNFSPAAGGADVCAERVMANAAADSAAANDFMTLSFQKSCSSGFY
jgi:hypothetical protein